MINVVLCADENYAQYGAVVMSSAIAHTEVPEQLHFHWLTPGLSEDTCSQLHAMIEATGAYLDIIEINDDLPRTIDLGRFGISTLLRLCMHHYLPQDCNKVIYLDCDVLVLGDLAELWSTPLGGCVLGAVMDLCGPSGLSSRAEPFNYFNAGVLLVDLEKWKGEQIGEKALACFNQNELPLKYLDQDALNHVISGDWVRLSPVWNLQPTAYAAVEKGYAHLQPVLVDLRNAIRFPRIIHFIGSIKPWHPQCVHPLQDLFLHFSRNTPWPIDLKNLRKTLPFSKRARLALKKPKIKRRAAMTAYRTK